MSLASGPSHQGVFRIPVPGSSAPGSGAYPLVFFLLTIFICNVLHYLTRTDNLAEPKQSRHYQRTPRARHLRLHHHDHHLPAPQCRGQYLWHEHQRRAQHAPQPVGLLGSSRPRHRRRHLPRVAMDRRVGEHCTLGCVVQTEEFKVSSHPR